MAAEADPELLRRIGERIKEARGEMKIPELARLIDSSERMIYAWENGENAASCTVIRAIAKATGVSADFLLALQPENGVLIDDEVIEQILACDSAEALSEYVEHEPAARLGARVGPRCRVAAPEEYAKLKSDVDAHLEQFDDEIWQAHLKWVEAKEKKRESS